MMPTSVGVAVKRYASNGFVSAKTPVNIGCIESPMMIFLVRYWSFPLYFNAKISSNVGVAANPKYINRATVSPIAP